MKASQNTPSRFDDEISFLDIFYFFKLHKKFILIHMILGMIFGVFFANFYGPMYKGSVLISPAKISGFFHLNPKTTVTKLKMNSFYSKETFINCKPYPDNDSDIPDIVNSSVAADGELILISMKHKNKIRIENCLKSIVKDVRLIQNIIVTPLIESKNNELMRAKEKLMAAEALKNQFSYELLKDLKKNSDPLNRISTLLTSNLILSTNLNIKQTMAEIDELTVALSSEKTKEAEMVVPIAIKEIASVYQIAFFGLLLGLCLGILIALIKQVKI